MKIKKPNHFLALAKGQFLPNNDSFKISFDSVLNFCFESSDAEKSNGCFKDGDELGNLAWFGKGLFPNFRVLIIKVKEDMKNKGLFSLIYLFFFIFIFMGGGISRA
jgi:hypothetical protein